MRYEGDLDGEYMGGKFGDFMKNTVKNVSGVTGKIQELIEGKPVAAPVATSVTTGPLGGPINPLMIGGIAAGAVVLMLVLKKRR